MQVKVYKNLTKNCYSIKTNRVIGHADTVMLKNVSFRVQEGVRLRVINEQKKYVHAFVCGELQFTDRDCNTNGFIKASYNPYKAGYFFNKETGDRIDNAKLAILNSDGLFILL